MVFTTFSTARSFALRLSRSGSNLERIQILRAVAAAGRAVPASNCLSEALTAWVLLSRGGYDPLLRIGVSTGEKFTAHAWVESDGVIVFGGNADHDYHPLQGPDVMRS